MESNLKSMNKVKETAVRPSRLEKTSWVLVSLMALLQGIYALYAFIDPAAFAGVRGTALLFSGDADWVRIYASRTVFVALIIGYLLYQRHYRILVWAALFGTVMPITDAYLAYEANAANKVVYKHIATVIYLILTSIVLSKVSNNTQGAPQHDI